MGRKAKKVPPSVSAELLAEHELTHLPFRSWYGSCVKGKGTEDFHRRREEEMKEDVARYCIDYCLFTKALAQDNAVSRFADLKEAQPEPKTVLEGSEVRALFTGVANSNPKKATAQPTPKGDSQANGAAERAVLELGNQVRTLKVAFEARYPGVKVTEDPWFFLGWSAGRAGL